MADKILVMAVLQADPNKIKAAGAMESDAVPRLESAEKPLRALLEQYSDTELSRQVTELLDQDKLFYVVGPWPPTQPAGPRPGGPTQVKICSKCGQILA
jgi:hypothetical protein